MTVFHSFSILLAITAAFSVINHRWLKLPLTIGVMVISLTVSTLAIIAGQIFPETFQELCDNVDALDFSGLLFDVLLSLLIFAGAFGTDPKMLAKNRTPIIILATLGVVISTFIVGGLMYAALGFLGVGIPFVHCLLFGALISPTDPIAVIAILRSSTVPKDLEIEIAGESLLNDGVAVVVFLTILDIAQGDMGPIGVPEVLELFGREVIGGVALGLALGWIGSRYVTQVREDKIDLMITLALVLGGYAIAEIIRVSGPLAMVVLGIYMALVLKRGKVSEESVMTIESFWESIDEMLNALLFMLIGIELIAITHDFRWVYIWGGLIAVVVVLFARFTSVALPLYAVSLKNMPSGKTLAVLTWGGLRGGISVALALTLPHELNRELIVSITYVVVLFSIMGQGLTIGKLVERLRF
ncbi:MAG: sodium:proton antiporter [Bacteroidota bacterium]